MKNLYLFLCLLAMFACSTPEKQEETVVAINDGEQYRPTYHFTPPSQWMNDPNGMVYYEGEYHLFYQFYPDSNVWGPMHWGHAVSKDMVRWEHLPIALYPDEQGFIFSGSAIIDWQNSSGFGTKENPPMVAIFTYHSMELEKAGKMYQTQAVAYSLDKGRTWAKYDKNPVLPNPGINDFRDPKVFWYAPQNKWIMMLAVKDHVNIYASANLKDWKLESEFGHKLGGHGGVWECPDMFPLKDERGAEKWVVLLSINPGGPQGGSATQYFVGNFNGKTFTPADTLTRWLDYGADNYAGVTFGDIPKEDGRRLFIGWMSNWQYAMIVPTYNWRSAMTIPRVLSINSANQLIQKPIAELEKLVKETKTIPDFTAEGTKKISELAFTSACRFAFDLNMQEAKHLTLLLGNGKESVALVIDKVAGTISLDRSKAGNASFHNEFAKVHTAAIGDAVTRVEVFVDAASIEIFINDGLYTFTDIVFPENSYTELSFQSEGAVAVSKFNWFAM